MLEMVRACRCFCLLAHVSASACVEHVVDDLCVAGLDKLDCIEHVAGVALARRDDVAAGGSVALLQGDCRIWLAGRVCGPELRARGRAVVFWPHGLRRRLWAACGAHCEHCGLVGCDGRLERAVVVDAGEIEGRDQGVSGANGVSCRPSACACVFQKHLDAGLVARGERHREWCVDLQALALAHREISAAPGKQSFCGCWRRARRERGGDGAKGATKALSVGWDESLVAGHHSDRLVGCPKGVALRHHLEIRRLIHILVLHKLGRLHRARRIVVRRVVPARLLQHSLRMLVGQLDAQRRSQLLCDLEQRSARAMRKLLGDCGICATKLLS
eukprot:comp16701_c0_seq1/m.27059 comp16701_c0_seq1/g.27059  ORF comp16701_c0_seq1/g.27059 comp16701_c0_seq1/m.27059 type:complete len:330 (+) comp16701_c0_seq1:193-1182(+)